MKNPSTDSASPPVNSRPWWDEHFRETWDSNNGRQQTRHFMERLLANLPEPESRFLRSGSRTILDWGCALGDGVDVLATVFPSSDVTGLDFSPAAVEKAARAYPEYRFLHSENGAIAAVYDVITNSNCLEHFEFPIALLESQLLACRDIFIALVPYNEHPLAEYHRAQFREESFPVRPRGFVRLHCAPIDVDKRFWPGQQLLVVYGSDAYLRNRSTAVVQNGMAPNDFSEKEKWNAYYAELPDVEEDSDTRRFNLEFAEAVSDLLPLGGATLETGCGAGWQSLALARTKRFQPALLDFSPDALAYAARLFQREGLNPRLIEQDLAQAGPPEFDLVFNAGVLEHYTADEQIALLRAMKSRSKRFVLVLVPNRRCYWYWLWRFHRSVEGEWKWGKEVPAESMAHLMQAAGIRFLGERYFGAAWSESFISEFFPDDGKLRDELLTIHRSPVIPIDQKAYLVAALGIVEGDAVPVSGWSIPVIPTADDTALLTAALADALALRNMPLQRDEALAQAIANNAELLERHREAVEQGRIEVQKRDEAVAYFQAREKELSRQLQEAASSGLLSRLGLAVRRWFG